MNFEYIEQIQIGSMVKFEVTLSLWMVLANLFFFLAAVAKDLLILRICLFG